MAMLFSKLKTVPVLLFGQLLTLFLPAPPAYASPILTELHPAPTTGQPEWIELHNPDPEPINLTGWQLWDELSSPSLLLTLSTTLEPGQTASFDLPSAKLNNGADGVQLRSPDGQVVNAFSYSTTEPAMSWLLSHTTWQLGDPTPNNYQSEPNPSPTPTADPTPSPTPTPLPTATPQPTPASPPLPSLSITELYPCPSTGETEYITIKNIGNSTVDLTQLLIRDELQNTRVASGTLEPHQTAPISWSTAMLNNTGDSVSILSATNVLLASAQYSSCATGEPLHFIAGEWQAATSETNSTTTEKQSITEPTATPSPSPTITPATPMKPPTTKKPNHGPLPLLNTTASSSASAATPSAHLDTANTLTYMQRHTPRLAIFNAILGGGLMLGGGTTVLSATHHTMKKPQA